MSCDSRGLAVGGHDDCFLIVDKVGQDFIVGVRAHTGEVSTVYLMEVDIEKLVKFLSQKCVPDRDVSPGEASRWSLSNRWSAYLRREGDGRQPEKGLPSRSERRSSSAPKGHRENQSVRGQPIMPDAAAQVSREPKVGPITALSV